MTPSAQPVNMLGARLNERGAASHFHFRSAARLPDMADDAFDEPRRASLDGGRRAFKPSHSLCDGRVQVLLECRLSIRHRGAASRDNPEAGHPGPGIADLETGFGRGGRSLLSKLLLAVGHAHFMAFGARIVPSAFAAAAKRFLT